MFNRAHGHKAAMIKVLLFILLLSSSAFAETVVTATVTQATTAVVTQPSTTTVEIPNNSTFVVSQPATSIFTVQVPGLATTGTGGEQINSDWLAVGTVAEILNKPTFTRGYDGREVEVRNSGTYIQWRYANALAWTDLVSLAALTGATGATGAAGTNGKNVLYGAANPSAGIGVDGEFYINTTTNYLFGPKTSGAWGAGVSLVGPAGTVTQASVVAAIATQTADVVVWTQQAVGESATAAKSGTKDSTGNAKQWIDGNGTMVRQCITSDTAPAFKMLSSAGVVIYTVSCDNTMVFKGKVTIQ
jgi:hypothetical protein